MTAQQGTGQQRENWSQVAVNVRRRILDLVYEAGSGHIGPSFSCVEILLAVHRVLVWPDSAHRPAESHRNRFVLSKGHGCPALYALWAELGLTNDAPLRSLDTAFQGHPDRRRAPLLDASAGALGDGFTVAVGLAAGLRLCGSRANVAVLLGDGECQEGVVWEAAMAASKYGLRNITAIVDCNGCQTDGFVADVMPVEPLAAKWASFGWTSADVDGHDLHALDRALDRSERARPHVVLARTVKGRGVSFMEGDPGWHSRAVSASDYARAARELASGTITSPRPE